MFLRKCVLKICSKFTGEPPCRSVISIKLLCNFIEITLRHGCSHVNLLHISRTPFSENTSGWLLPIIGGKYPRFTWFGITCAKSPWKASYAGIFWLLDDGPFQFVVHCCFSSQCYRKRVWPFQPFVSWINFACVYDISWSNLLKSSTVSSDEF